MILLLTLFSKNWLNCLSSIHREYVNAGVHYLPLFEGTPSAVSHLLYLQLLKGLETVAIDRNPALKSL